MANAQRQASLVRKFIYFGLIALLFTVTIFWRGKIRLPFLSDATILAQAENLELRELDQGEEADLTGNAVSLSLTGSRGLAVSALWWIATEKQKRHEWNELELIVKSITKLQPHFITPWMFQSWNITYNVSVESDRLNDMYYFIARGIELLAEGERRNKNNPDLRWWVAFTYQNKFGVSDKVSTLRCLYALSCIPPEDRDPKKLMSDGRLNVQAFQEFCKKYPQLVRRLRETPIKDKSGETLCERPEDVVRFLIDNAKVPSRYKDARELADATKQFPVVPRRFETGQDELQPDQAFNDADSDAFLASRAWYKYSLEPLPDPEGEPIAIPDVIPKGKRLPRKPALIIFRQGAPRAQSYLAERMQKEGWFDEEGWIVDKDRDPADKWFDTTMILGSGQKWSKREWEKAHEMWEKHGLANGLLLRSERLEGYQKQAQYLKDYLREQGRTSESLDSTSFDLRLDEREDPKLVAAFAAQRKLLYYRQNLDMTNYNFFLYNSEGEMDDRTIQARKLLYEADKIKGRGDYDAAIKMYQKSFDLWKQTFEAHPSFHRDTRTHKLEEDSYERELAYLELLRDWYGPRLREQAVQMQSLGFAAGMLNGTPLAIVAMPSYLEKLGVDYKGQIPLVFRGPFDGIDLNGKPWIDNDIKQQVRARLGLDRSATPAPETAPPPKE